MSRRLSADVVHSATALLGEGPIWDDESGTLLWVDIARAEVHRLNPSTGNDTLISAGHVTGAVSCSRDGEVVLAAADGFWKLASDGSERQIAEVEVDEPLIRINDAKCDRVGRFWAGTISVDLQPGAGGLCYLETDGRVYRVLTGLTVPNGLGFSPDGSVLYFIDSFLYGVDAYPFDQDEPWLGPPRRVVDVPTDLGLADGMTVDADGSLWVAMFGGSCVRQYGPDGSAGATIELPVTHPTSCAFGGKDLDTLFITSARSDERGPMTPDLLAPQPLAGAVFACRPGSVGLPADRCAC
jgi:sugar lactone lactonase YvrE